jgi:hypothetical protein
MKRIIAIIQRFFILFLVSIAITALAVWQWTSGEFLTAFVLMWGIPISRIFMIGNLRNRLVNGLSFIAIYVYLLLGVRFSLWDEASYLLMATPYLSIAIKPKRSWLKYLTVGITTLYLIYGWISGNQIGWPIKIFTTLSIYAIFFPSIVKSTIRQVKSKSFKKESNHA